MLTPVSCAPLVAHCEPCMRCPELRESEAVAILAGVVVIFEQRDAPAPVAADVLSVG